MTNETATAITTEEATNDKRLPDFMKTVTKLGEEAGLGKDSLPKLAHVVVRAVADGVIDATVKNAKGEDLAEQLYARYSAAEGKKAIHDQTNGGKKANVSKLRQLINMGAMTTIDAVEVMQEAMEVRKDLASKAGEDKSIKLKSVYPYYVDVAREQQKQDSALTRDQLDGIARKPEGKEKDATAELKRVHKILENLIAGERGIQDQSEEVITAFEAIDERLKSIATMALTNELRAKASALGLSLV